MRQKAQQRGRNNKRDWEETASKVGVKPRIYPIMMIGQASKDIHIQVYSSQYFLY